MINDAIDKALLEINPDRIANRIAALAEIGVEPSGGVTRLGISPEEEQARDLVESWLRPSGYMCERDGIGNLFCRASTEIQVLVGSHLDSVRDGGRYDGALGVVAAVEVAEAAHAAKLPIGIEVVAWTNEEGARFGRPLFGSAAALGLLSKGWLDQRDAAGITVADAAADLFGQPPDPKRLSRSSDIYPAHLELHIEQGPELERLNAPIGIVTAIVGLYHGRVEILGEANHAGTTPMDDRKDAAAAAAEAIVAIEALIRVTIYLTHP